MVITKRDEIIFVPTDKCWIYQNTTSILFETYEIYTDYFDLKSIDIVCLMLAISNRKIN